MDMATFWPVYLREHSRPLTRALHYAGSLLALAWLAATVVLANPWLLLAALVSGYGFAWAAHAFVEKNRPATFTHPWLSFVCDWRMLATFLAGRMGRTLRRHGIEARRRPDAATT